MKEYTINEWCEIFGIELVDNDGFRYRDLNNGIISLELFICGIVECTINPVNKDKYSVLEKLW